jgi:hypothetical protein
MEAVAYFANQRLAIFTRFPTEKYFPYPLMSKALREFRRSGKISFYQQGNLD